MRRFNSADCVHLTPTALSLNSTRRCLSPSQRRLQADFSLRLLRNSTLDALTDGVVHSAAFPTDTTRRWRRNSLGAACLCSAFLPQRCQQTSGGSETSTWRYSVQLHRDLGRIQGRGWGPRLHDPCTPPYHKRLLVLVPPFTLSHLPSTKIVHDYTPEPYFMGANEEFKFVDLRLLMTTTTTR